MDEMSGSFSRRGPQDLFRDCQESIGLAIKDDIRT